MGLSGFGWLGNQKAALEPFIKFILLDSQGVTILQDAVLNYWQSSCQLCRRTTPGALILNHLSVAKTTEKS